MSCSERSTSRSNGLNSRFPRMRCARSMPTKAPPTTLMMRSVMTPIAFVTIQSDTLSKGGTAK